MLVRQFAVQEDPKGIVLAQTLRHFLAFLVIVYLDSWPSEPAEARRLGQSR